MFATKEASFATEEASFAVEMSLFDQEMFLFGCEGVTFIFILVRIIWLLNAARLFRHASQRLQ
jgi:hypothetical protein